MLADKGKNKTVKTVVQESERQQQFVRKLEEKIKLYEKRDQIMGDRSITKPLGVLNTCAPSLSASMDDVENIEMEDSENEDNNLPQDGMLNDDGNQLVSLSTLVSTMDASTSSPQNAVDTPNGLLLATPMVTTRHSSSKGAEGADVPTQCRQQVRFHQNEENQKGSKKYYINAHA